MDSDCTMSSVEWHRLYNKERLRANAAEEKLKALEARTPAPATDVDALLAEVEMLLAWSCSDVKDNPGAVLQTVSILATALRESRAREVAEPYRHALEQRLICSNLPLLTGDADADLMRFVFHEQEVAGYFCGQLEAALQAEREGREQAEASVEQWKLDSRQRSAVCDERTAERDTLRAQLTEANAALALCAENTAAADLAQEVEFLKAELAEAQARAQKVTEQWLDADAEAGRFLVRAEAAERGLELYRALRRVDGHGCPEAGVPARNYSAAEFLAADQAIELWESQQVASTTSEDAV